MPKQREIREKALLALFAYATQKENPSIDDSTWELSLEPEQEKLNKAAYKALAHQLSALPQRVEEFNEVAALIAPMMKTYELKKEARTTLAITKTALQLQTKFSLLSKSSKRPDLSEFYHASKALRASLQELEIILEEATFTAPELTKMRKRTRALADLVQRADLVDNPLSHKDVTSISALVKATSEIDSLKVQASAYATGVIDNLDEIDPVIEANLTNFAADKIGRVERSLLRLGAYEIMTLGLPKGIVINEIIELSRKFTTEDAVPLINAVLDKV